MSENLYGSERYEQSKTNSKAIEDWRNRLLQDNYPYAYVDGDLHA